MSLRFKIVLTILLALIFSYLVYGSMKPKYKIEDVVAFYAELNEDYYMGQLPKDVKFALVTDLQDSDGHDLIANTMCLMNHCTMTINTTFNLAWNQAQMSIIHESCHLKLNNTNMKERPQDANDHGPIFNQCMANAATHGAMDGKW
jgi:hypothetical protein